jgi:formamidopyrimidine-DNA glycosylase
MPELPEVQTVVNHLKVYEQKHLTDIKIYDFKLIAQEKVYSLKNALLLSVTRRGKYVLFSFCQNLFLIVHLRMTGQFLMRKEREKHDRAVFLFRDHLPLFFKDTRRFGTFLLTHNPAEVFQKLGREPLDSSFVPEEFHQKLLVRKQSLKAVLLDQSFLAGLGNIYTDEALWRAALHPEKKAFTLSFLQAKKLLFAIREVLQKGLNTGGTSLGKGDTNFHALNGQTGKNQNDLWVYAREDKPCTRCKRLIKKIYLQQRGTHFCMFCQQK